MRVAVLIDTQNIFHSFKNVYSGKADFDKILAHAVNGRQLIRAIAYCVVNTETNQQDKFLYFLNQLGIETRTKELIRRADTSAKANMDIELVLDAVEIAPRIDTLVLVTGDGDMSVLVDWLKSRGVRVELLAVPQTCAMNLKNVVHEFTPLTQDYILESNDDSIQNLAS